MLSHYCLLLWLPIFKERYKWAKSTSAWTDDPTSLLDFFFALFALEDSTTSLLALSNNSNLSAVEASGRAITVAITQQPKYTYMSKNQNLNNRWHLSAWLDICRQFLCHFLWIWDKWYFESLSSQLIYEEGVYFGMDNSVPYSLQWFVSLLMVKKIKFHD